MEFLVLAGWICKVQFDWANTLVSIYRSRWYSMYSPTRRNTDGYWMTNWFRDTPPLDLCDFCFGGIVQIENPSEKLSMSFCWFQ